MLPDLELDLLGSLINIIQYRIIRILSFLIASRNLFLAMIIRAMFLLTLQGLIMSLTVLSMIFAVSILSELRSERLISGVGLMELLFLQVLLSFVVMGLITMILENLNRILRIMTIWISRLPTMSLMLMRQLKGTVSRSFACILIRGLDLFCKISAIAMKQVLAVLALSSFPVTIVRFIRVLWQGILLITICSIILIWFFQLVVQRMMFNSGLFM